jgi:hypothetical protein
MTFFFFQNFLFFFWGIFVSLKFYQKFVGIVHQRTVRISSGLKYTFLMAVNKLGVVEHTCATGYIGDHR